MRSLRTVFLLLVGFMASGWFAHAQSTEPASKKDGPTSVSASSASASRGASATEEEVNELRHEVAELKAQMRRLIEASAQTQSGVPHLALVNAVANPAPDLSPAAPATVAEVEALATEVSALQDKANTAPPITAGWNGEHFFLKSSDGNFTLMPVGYLDGQYTFYNGNGAPPDTFAITRARFGVQGNYGKQLDYTFLFETASALTIRDAYMDFKPWSAFKIMAGQYKVPFSMEVGTADTSVEFYNRSIISVLYPDAGGAFRAPGIDVHGDLAHGAAEYWVGLFNGQGLLTSGTTNEPEVVGRVRFTPWKNTKNNEIKGLSFGGSFEHSRSKGLANELSFSGLMNDSTYTFFPQFKINGGVERYNGFFSWLSGPLGIRGEYAHLLQKRSDIGSLATGGIGFNTIPGVLGNGAYVSATYLLTGEREPENAIPRVRHPVIGPNSPGESGAPGWGAWAVKARYSWLEGRANGATCDATTVPACPITPGIVPSWSDHTDQLTVGFNWYLNYWVLVKSDFNLNQLKDPSVQGILPRNYFVFLEGLQFRF
ncbi:MAG: porin [Candidatus Sulfotelmatobacter sp.]